MSTVEDLYQSGIRAHQAGQLDAARSAYEQVLNGQPQHAGALNALGLLAVGAKQFEQARTLLEQATKLAPDQADYFCNLAEAYRGLGFAENAIASYQRALELAPNDIESHNNLGTLYQAAGCYQEAQSEYERALLLQPLDVNCRFNLATALQRQGLLDAAATAYEQVLLMGANHWRALVNLGGIRLAEQNYSAAQRCYEQALSIDPTSGQVHYNLGNLSLNQGESDRAIEFYRRAIELEPSHVEAMCNLGSALQDVRQYEEAICVLERARKLRPDFSIAHCNLGIALQDVGRLPEARECLERALALEPGKLEYVHNLGALTRDEGDIPRALEMFRHVLARWPNCPNTRASVGTAQLTAGEFLSGWEGYEARIGLPQFDTRTFPRPRWDGKPLGNSKLLVHCEQGLGDILQFVRYVPLLESFGENIILAAPPALMPLLAQSGYRGLVSLAEPLPPFDVHVPLMSLPYVFGTVIDTIPCEVPYLRAEPSLVAQWRQGLGEDDHLRVGLVWQGKPTFRGNRLRSLPFEVLEPLFSIPNVRYFSLQQGLDADERQSLARWPQIEDLGSRIDAPGRSFLDSTAILANLDLVITCDTAMAHLAGAMAVPVWVALRRLPDWRWMLERETSPWYPTMRLFRQTTLGQWSDVIERIAAELPSQPDRGRAGGAEV